MQGSGFVRRALLAPGLVLAATAAHADAIDGDRCSATGGLHVRIEGPNVTMPAGTQTTGTYTRHAFSYVVPPSDPGAGDAISMQPLNDDEARVAGFSDASEVWRRCQFNA